MALSDECEGFKKGRCLFNPLKKRTCCCNNEHIQYAADVASILMYFKIKDNILDMTWKEASLANDDLENYKAKVEYYLKEHEDNIVINKLKTNKPLTNLDVKELEKIMWHEIGTRQEYENEYGDTPMGELVRSVVGLSVEAANEAFSEYLNSNNLNSVQIDFVKRVVDYVVKNGIMKDLSVLGEYPFDENGSITEIFDMGTWSGIKKVIDAINDNAVA